MVARVTLTPKISNKPPVVGCRYDSRSDSYRLDKIFGGIPAGLWQVPTLRLDFDP